MKQQNTNLHTKPWIVTHFLRRELYTISLMQTRFHEMGFWMWKRDVVTTYGSQNVKTGIFQFFHIFSLHWKLYFFTLSHGFLKCITYTRICITSLKRKNLLCVKLGVFHFIAWIGRKRADASIRKTPMSVIPNFIARSAIIQISYAPISHKNLLYNWIHCDKNTRFMKSPMWHFVSK